MRQDAFEFAKETIFQWSFGYSLGTYFIQDSADKHISLTTSRSVSSVPWIIHEI